MLLNNAISEIAFNLGHLNLIWVTKCLALAHIGHPISKLALFNIFLNVEAIFNKNICFKELLIKLLYEII